jgi:gluconolactonase
MTSISLDRSTDEVFVTIDEQFSDVLGEDPQLVRIVDVDAHEGPVYADGALYFTTSPRDGKVSILQLELDGLEAVGVNVLRESANAANGMTLAPDGRLLVCEQGSLVDPARISVVDRASGHAETVVDSLDGLPLNSPNDVVARSDGTVWFTDPSYGHLQGFRPEPALGDFVYRYEPFSRWLSAVALDFDKPNGLAFSPDERVLYVGDSGANHEPGSFEPRRPHHVRAFDVAGEQIVNGRLFAVTEPGFPDGLKVDADGRVYASAFSGVQVFDPAGELIGEIHLPGAVNFTFGGLESNVLFITTDTAVWAAVLNTKGA